MRTTVTGGAGFVSTKRKFRKIYQTMVERKHQMNNIIFQVNIKGKRHKSAFDLSTKSWKHWADKNNCDVVVLDDFVVDESYMKPNWQKWYVFDLLDNSGVEYNKICVVDADTIVHPDCPNFFDEVGNDFCAVRNDG